MRLALNLTCRSQLPGASVGRPRALRVVQQSRGLCHTARRPHSRRDGSKASTGLAPNSDDCDSLACRLCPILAISEEALTHAISLLSQRQPSFLPLLEVLSRINRATDMALRPHAPVLRERRGADDGRLIDSPFAPDLVGTAVALEGTVARVVAVVGGIVLVAEVFDHVVFDERVCGPAVEAEVCVAVGAEGAGVVEEPAL